MRLNRIVTPAALVLALVASGVPASAQARERGGERRQDGRSARSNPGKQQRGDNRGARAQTNRDQGPNGNAGRYEPRPNNGRDYAVPRYSVPPPRAPYRNDYGPGRPGNDYKRDGHGRNDYPYGRTYYAPSYRYAYPNRGYGSGYYARPYYGPRGGVRFGLGVSIFAGTPFGFSFVYGRAPAYAYRYPMRQGIAYGGVSFLVDPDFAEVYIDGVFVGHAREFGGQPVPVSAGYHRVELYAPNCEGVGFDVHIVPGQVIPYRGSLVPGY